MARQTVTAPEVPIYRSAKALALVMAGHDPSNFLELDGQVITWFRETPAFQADVKRYELLHPLLMSALKPDAPVSLERFLEVVRNARQSK